MPDNPTDQAIRSRLSAIFPNEEVRQKIIKIVTTTIEKPDSYGHDSHSPYYRKHYGEQMMKLAEDQLTTLKDIIFDYKTFCKPWNLGGCSEQTLYNRVNQSIRYLVERLDTADGKYLSWKDITRVQRIGDVGVVISIDPEIKAIMSGNTDNVPMPRLAEPMSDKPEWKRELDRWVESDDTSPFVRRNLILTPDEQEQIRNELMGDRRIESLVTSSEIRCLKVNTDAL